MKKIILIVALVLAMSGVGYAQAPWTQIPGATPDSPSTVTVGNVIYMLVVGGDGSPYITLYDALADTYWNLSACNPANVFTPWLRLSGFLGSHPSLAVTSTAGVFLFVQGGGGTIWRGNVLALAMEACAAP